MRPLAPLLLLAIVMLLRADEAPATRPATRPDLTELPPVQTDNRNALLITHRKRLQFTASTVWPGWPADKAFDGDLETSWFSAGQDAAALGKRPWIAVTFPEEVSVRRVTILGNREPKWLKGYAILAGKIELLDRDNKALHQETNEGLGNFRDFDFKTDKPVAGIRCIRFTSLGDEGDQNPYQDIAIAEIQVE